MLESDYTCAYYRYFYHIRSPEIIHGLAPVFLFAFFRPCPRGLAALYITKILAHSTAIVKENYSYLVKLVKLMKEYSSPSPRYLSATRHPTYKKRHAEACRIRRFAYHQLNIIRH
jgi:hypothetical protein